MKMTDALLGEHALFYPLFDGVEELLFTATNVQELRAAFKVLERAVLSHASIEEEVLFPALIASRVAGGPLTVMRQEHQDIDRRVVAFYALADLEAAKDALRAIVAHLRTHFRQEEQLLFPMCEATLGEAKLLALGEVWAKKRGL